MSVPRLTAAVAIASLLAFATVFSSATLRTYPQETRDVKGAVAARQRATVSHLYPQRALQDASIVFVEAPVIAAGSLRTRFPKGSRLVRLKSGGSRNVINLTADFSAAADPQVSFDGQRILFAGLRSSDTRWQIWEMQADGTAQRQITRSDGDCLRPAYLAREGIVYTAVTSRDGVERSQIHVVNMDGSEDDPITFGPGNFQVETVLKDGRVLASAVWPLVAGVKGSTELYTLRHDGSALASYRCEHQQTAVRAQAAELDDGSLVFIKKTDKQEEAGGELAMIRPGALHNSTLSPLAPVVWSPAKLAGEELLVARKNPRASTFPEKFSLYTYDATRGAFGRLVYEDVKLSSVEAVPVTAHARPRWYWSTLKPGSKTGYFICLDAYHSVDAPGDRLTANIARVRVLMYEGATAQERVLGEAPVESDGSFFIAVPADQPVRFELLDPAGKVIRAQKSWLWARPGEEHGCVGCHEDKSVAPTNRWPLTLRRFDTPTQLGVEVPALAEH
jgi:hypothetical protein